MIKQCREKSEACLQCLIEEGRDAGFWSVADARLATLTMLGILNWPYRWINPVGRLRIEQLAEKFLALIMHSPLNGCL